MDSSTADGLATRQVPEFSVISSAAAADLLPLLLATSGCLLGTETLPKTPHPCFSLDSKKIGGRRKRCPPPSFLFIVAPCQRSSAGATDAKLMRFHSWPCPVWAKPALLCTQKPAKKMLLLGHRGSCKRTSTCVFSSMSLCARICHIFTKKRTIFQPHPFTHSFIQHIFITCKACSDRRLQK